MRIESPSFRSRLFGQVAVAALLSGLATGCSADANRVNSFQFTGATPNQRAIIEQQAPSYSAASYSSPSYDQPSYGSSNEVGQGYGYTGSVGKAAVKPVSRPVSLPPVANRPVPTVPADSAIRSERTASAPSLPKLSKIFSRSETPSAPAPTPVVAAATPMAVAPAGQTSGWTGTGGTVISMREGDTLYSVSRRYGVPTDALMRVNGISDPAQVRPGQQITIPTYVYSSSTPISAPDAGSAGRIARMETEPVPVPAARPGYGRPTTVAALPDMTPTGSIGNRPTPVAAVSAAPAGGTTHVVNPGESLGGIAARYGMSSRDLMKVNNIDNANHIRVGQRIVIPAAGGARLASADTGTMVDATYTGSIPAAAARTAPYPQPKPTDRVAYRPVPPITADTRQMTTASIPQPTARPAVSGAKSQPSGYTPPTPVRASEPEEPAAVAAGDNAGRSANGTTFRWPVRGRIISEFGAKPDGQRNDGINLAVPEGTSVKSAEDGVVVYSGSELKGYGNLVLVKHADGWVSAYAHNSELMVQRGDTVSRGQIIARAGKTGGVTTPQLHFELRKGSKPVDPLQYLSSS
ncbi:MAG TPA: peptidoglycan DD-metalloendopeptidase family protein [Hyphomicrobiales bacterium]|nr:peptidoglycan DD-metalloendopeptidase family protein [Hyphomicrobiales bacterium]